MPCPLGRYTTCVTVSFNFIVDFSAACQLRFGKNSVMSRTQHKQPFIMCANFGLQINNLSSPPLPALLMSVNPRQAEKVYLPQNKSAMINTHAELI